MKMLVADQARVKECLHYDEMTGVFTWRKRRGGGKAGAVAGALKSIAGYRMITLDNRHFLAHRLAWLYVHGVMPPAEIDHINGIPADNSIANLRLATRSENQCNSGPLKSASGLKGAHWNARKNMWVSGIWKDKKRRHLGYFATAEEAHAAYVKAAGELHGQFARAA